MAKEDWKLCVEWLVRCQILSDDHKLVKSDAQVFDLVQFIRDGVVLCHVLNQLSPGCINQKDFSQRPQMSQFLCLKNIRVFLQTCRSVFGMSDDHLFEPSDLLDIKDFGKVINTMCILSCTTLAQSKVPGFKTRSRQDYFSLQTLATDALDDDYDVVCRDDDHEIYEDLCALRRRSSFQEPAPVTKRDYCINELAETEKNYIDALAMIINFFIKRLRGRIPEIDHGVIFLGIEDLHLTHSGFHMDLSKACSSRHNTFTSSSSTLTIADCFVRWKEKFLKYGEFCSNLPRVQATLDKLMQNQSTNQAITECQNEANGGKFRLRDLLSVPMQRVLKYHLLLKELIKNTDAQHPERNCLERALDEMQDLAGYVNEVKRDNENMQVILDVERSIVDLEMPENTNLLEYGRLLKDGELRVRKGTEKKDKNLMLFLFDKVLLICKSRGESYNFRDGLILAHFDVEELPPKDKDKFTFTLVTKSLRPEQPTLWFFTAKTQDIRSKWVDTIRLAHENTCPPFSDTELHKFVMASFTEPTICDVCRKLLRGKFYQGYRCQKTQMAVHKACIEKAKDMLGPPVIPPKPVNRLGPSSPLPNASNRSLRGIAPKAKEVKAISAYHGMPVPPSGRPLTFEANSIISLLSDDDNTWWLGQLQGREGYFPKNFVILQSKPLRRDSYLDTENCDTPTPPVFTGPCPLPPTASIRQLHGAGRGLALPPRSSSMNGNYVVTTPPVADELSPFPWYIGELNRDEATRMLNKMPNGTFLIRVSNTGNRKGEHALSIRYGPTNPVKHIKVQRNADGMYFLVECKMFRSIPELVQYYQANSLERSFPEVPCTLGTPYKDAVNPPTRDHTPEPGVVGIGRAQYDFSPMEPNQIAFKVGDSIAILSKSRGNRGWWKGKIDGRIGFFPSEYVVEL